jgi:hypothetical protein
LRPVNTTLSALITTTWSPVSTCGVKSGPVLAAEAGGDIGGQTADNGAFASITTHLCSTFRAQVDLSVDGETFIDGLCSGPAGTEGIMRLAFWTLGNNRVLQAGIVKESGGELTWERGDSTFTDFPIQSCAYTEDTLVASPRAMAAAPLIRGQVSALLSLEPDSGLKLSTDLGMTTTDVNIRNGLSVFAPEKPVAMAAMGTMMSGGYPGGVIALAGEIEPGKSQVVFVDPSPITLPNTQTGSN